MNESQNIDATRDELIKAALEYAVSFFEESTMKSFKKLSRLSVCARKYGKAVRADAVWSKM